MVPQTRRINLTINHISGDYVNYMLKECGWSGRTEFEMNAPTENNFPFDIKNHLIHSQPDYNLTFNPMYNLYQLSLHSLTTFTRTYLYGLMNNQSAVEYELENPGNKTIYVHFPIKSLFMRKNLDIDKPSLTKTNETATMTGTEKFFFGKPDNVYVRTFDKKAFERFFYRYILVKDTSSGYLDLRDYEIEVYRPGVVRKEHDEVKFWDNLEKQWFVYPSVIKVYDKESNHTAVLRWNQQNKAYIIPNTLANVNFLYKMDIKKATKDLSEIYINYDSSYNKMEEVD